MPGLRGIVSVAMITGIGVAVLAPEQVIDSITPEETRTMLMHEFPDTGNLRPGRARAVLVNGQEIKFDEDVHSNYELSVSLLSPTSDKQKPDFRFKGKGDAKHLEPNSVVKVSFDESGVCGFSDQGVEFAQGGVVEFVSEDGKPFKLEIMSNSKKIAESFPIQLTEGDVDLDRQHWAEDEGRYVYVAEGNGYDSYIGEPTWDGVRPIALRIEKKAQLEVACSSKLDGAGPSVSGEPLSLEVTRISLLDALKGK